MLPSQSLMNTSPQRSMLLSSLSLLLLPLSLTLALLLLLLLMGRDEVTSTLPFDPSTLRQIQDPPGQIRDFAFTLTILFERVIIIVVILPSVSVSTLTIPSTCSGSGW